MQKTLLLFFILSSSYLTAQNNGWQISTKESSDYTGIAIANGRIGMLTSSKPFQIQHIVLNNVYDVDPNLKVSQILHGMNFGNLDMYIDGEKVTEDNISNWQQTMDMKSAALTTSFEYKDKAKISCTIYALRNLQYTGYIDISVQATKDIDVKVSGKILIPKEYQTPVNTFQVLKDLETTMPILQSVAKSPFGKHLVSTSSTFIWHKINSSREHQRPELKHEIISDYENTLSFDYSIKKNENLDFAWTGAECTTKDFADPKSESERMVIFNLLNSKEVLLAQHKAQWNKLWQGDIVIEGDLQSQQDVRLALYHLYAFGRGDSNLSIAPMGLSLQPNNNGSYSIDNVVGANEFAPNVNDNAFTNGAAITALEFATKAAMEIGVTPNPEWKFVSEKIKILKFKDGTTKEHENYEGEIIKQADVNLLSFPLNIVSDKETILKDLKYYEPKLSKEGPAMGKSIFSILYARQGDVSNAYRLFKESYVPNQQPPFGALSEVATSNFSYFATGAGGMLQSVLFGFGGLEFTDNGIVQKNPMLPKEWKSLTIKGVGKSKKTFRIEN